MKDYRDGTEPENRLEVEKTDGTTIILENNEWKSEYIEESYPRNNG